MTKYSVSVIGKEESEGVALFSDKVNFSAIINFCYDQFECGNSLTTPGENIVIIDLQTGEIVWDWQDEQRSVWTDDESFTEKEDVYVTDYSLYNYEY